MKGFQNFSKSFGPGSINASIFTLCSAIIGAGAMSIPYALLQCGVGFGLLLMILCSAGYYYFNYITIYSMSQLGSCNHITLAGELYGPVLRKITVISFLLTGMGNLISYILLVGQFITGVLADLEYIPEASMFWQVSVLGFFLLCVWIPMSIPTQLTSLRYFTICSTLGIAYITLVVTLDAPMYIAQQELGIQRVFEYQISRKIFDALGVFYFALNSSPISAIVFGEMKERTVDKFHQALVPAYGMVTVFYSVLGVLGALSYGDQVSQLVVFRPYVGTDWAMIFGKLFVGLYLTIATIINLNPTRTGVLNFLFYDGYVPTFQVHNITNIGLLSISCVFAVLLPDILVYFKVIGGLVCGFIAFTLPTLFYIQVQKDGSSKFGVLLAGLFFTGLGLSIVVDLFV